MFSGGIGFLMFSWGIEKDHWQKWVNKSSWRRSLQEFVAESAPPFIPICLIISVFQYFEECEHLQEMGRVNVQNPQLSQRLATIIFLTFRSLYPKKKKNFCLLFMDGVQLAQGYNHFEEPMPLRSQKFLILEWPFVTLTTLTLFRTSIFRAAHVCGGKKAFFPDMSHTFYNDET